MHRVLIIDDDAQIRMMLRMTFEDEGYRVEEAPNGKIGIALFRQDPPDVVITDIFMPEKEGIETIIELKRDYPDVKIITISGGGKVSPEEYLDVAESLGSVLTFSKPFDRQDIVKAVDKIVGKTGSPAP